MIRMVGDAIPQVEQLSAVQSEVADTLHQRNRDSGQMSAKREGRHRHLQVAIWYWPEKGTWEVSFICRSGEGNEVLDYSMANRKKPYFILGRYA
ncbi:hypothetical protein NDU88_003776 [Pleurodeles waltl]|uniref:Uncharacterized protein n=1 Tax=Pleurodeles waltl TaxID=8319 RepID=A0AAV7MUF2_PLEWA|nr:hypothetical protein NDU88_003776 [Pleurodeles waltl]